MPTVDFWSKEVLGGRSGRVSIVVQLPENPELYFPQQAVVYNRSDGKFYQLSGAGWAVISSLGAEDFVGLTDTPGAYAGEGQKLVRVNAGETGLEFVEAAAGGATALGDLTDVTPTGAGSDDLLAYDGVAGEWVVSARRVPDPAGAEGGEIIQVSAGSLVYVDPEFLQGLDGEDGIGVPTGTSGDVGKVPVLIDAPSTYQLQFPPAAVMDEVIVDADASGALSYDLSVARTIRSTITGNVTGAAFTNLPDAGTWVWIIKMDATGDHMTSGLHTVDRWSDGRSYDDINRSPNATTILIYTWDGVELTGTVAWNGVLELDAREMNFQEDGTIIVPITRSETLDLGDVTHLEADGTAGTGTLSYKKNDGADLALEPQAFVKGEVLSVTLTSSTTPSAVSIPRRLT